jgi:YQGE family putative transporter
MEMLKKTFGDENIDKDFILLLTIGGLYALSIALSNTFVNVYLWKQSGEFLDIALYNLAIVFTQPITFILAGRWAKKIDRVIVLRLGVSSLSFFYLTVLFVGERATQNLLLLGSLLGLGLGFYWLAYNVLTFEITEPETRDAFNGFSGLLTSFGGMVGPILAGWIISSLTEFTGYTVVFSISLALFIGAVTLSLFLKRRPAKGVYSFVRIIKERKNNNDWKLILNAHFFQGLREGSFVFVITMWVFITTESEMALGTFAFVNSAVAFIFYFLATKFIKPHFRKKAILSGGMMLYASLFLILFQLTFAKLIIYAVLIAIAYPIILVPYFSLTYDVIGKAWKAAEMRIEYIVVRELFLNGGRITSILMFLVAITFFDEQKSIPILMAIVGSGHLLIYFVIKNVTLVNSKRQADKDHKYASKMYKRGYADGEGGSTV